MGFTIFELIGGYYVNSVAIISDAIHDLGDSLSLGTAWYLDRKSKRKADKDFSFGYARFSLLGALLNSVVLILGSIFVVYEAVGRFIEPEHANASGMIAFAIVGVVVNGYAAYKMSGGKSLNEKVISWHLLEDVLGWVAVLIVGVVLSFKDIEYLDPALSLLIAAYILWGVFKRLKETLFIFLQGVPKEIDLTQIERQLLGIKKVWSVSNTHVWSLEGEHHVFSTHLMLKPSSLEQVMEIKQVAKEVLKPYGFLHCTIDIDVEQPNV